MDAAKISLSAKELQLVTNAGWILTKNSILKKVKQLLEVLLEDQKKVLSSASHLPEEIYTLSPKISKGENYNGLPYLVLDHPRYFGKENVLAVRTLFWWGNFFSITLHLAGDHKKKFEQACISAYPLLKAKGFYTCVNDEPWEHHFEKNNFAPVSTLTKSEFKKMVKERSFIKLAAKIELKQWDKAGDILLQYFKQIIKMLAG